MMIEYKEFVLKRGKKDIAVIVHEKNGEILSSFLYSDVSAFEVEIKKGINEVLSGLYTEYSMSGNATRLEIKGETAKVYDLFAEDEAEYIGTCFTISARELKNIVDEWCERLKEFNK